MQEDKNLQNLEQTKEKEVEIKAQTKQQPVQEPKVQQNKPQQTSLKENQEKLQSQTLSKPEQAQQKKTQSKQLPQEKTDAQTVQNKTIQSVQKDTKVQQTQKLQEQIKNPPEQIKKQQEKQKQNLKNQENVQSNKKEQEKQEKNNQEQKPKQNQDTIKTQKNQPEIKEQQKQQIKEVQTKELLYPQAQKQTKSKQQEISSVQQTQEKPEIKQQRLQPKQQPKKSSNILKDLLQNKRKLASTQKPKPNPLLIEDDIKQEQIGEQKIVKQAQLHIPERQQVNRSSANNCSILNLPDDLKQEALNIISQQNHQNNQIFEKIKEQIKISILGTEIKGSALSKHTYYILKGQDMHGPFYVKRRYSQFMALRKILMNRWPGCYIPGLRNKFNIKNQNQKQQSLKRVLQNFLIGLSFSKYFYYKEQVQLFLRSGDIDIEQMVSQMPQLRTSDLLSRFQYALYDQLEIIEKNKASITNTQFISNFHKNLKKMSTTLDQICEKVYKLAESYEIYNNSIAKFPQLIKLYQHISLAQFTQNNRQKTIFVKDQQKNIQKLASNQIKQNNPYYEVYRILLIQQVDIKSMCDILIILQVYYIKKQSTIKQIAQNQKQKMVLKPQQADPNNNSSNNSNVAASAIKNLPTTLLTSKKYKQQKYQKILQNLKRLYQQKQCLLKLIDIVEYNVVKNVIPMFKLLKKTKYYQMILKYIQTVQKKQIQEEHIWRYVGLESRKMEGLCEFKLE